MAYAGTTSTSPNPPQAVTQPIAGPRQWVYISTHTSTEVTVANFVTDGLELGMKVGDPVLVIGSTTYIITSHAVSVVGSTTTTLSTGSAHSS